MNEIEERLWNYIDGSCSVTEQKALDVLIETDEAYRLKYEELIVLNAEFSAMELDEPSMAFTYKVMETIRTENARQPLKSAIDKRIVWGLGAFFTLTIVALLAVALVNINWSAGFASSSSTSIQINIPHLSNYFNSSMIKVFIFLDVILSLFLLDSYLRKKLTGKQAL